MVEVKKQTTLSKRIRMGLSLLLKALRPFLDRAQNFIFSLITNRKAG